MLCDCCKYREGCALQSLAQGKSVDRCVAYEYNLKLRNTRRRDRKMNQNLKLELPKLDREEQAPELPTGNYIECDVDNNDFLAEVFKDAKVCPKKVENYNNAATIIKALARSSSWVVGCNFYPPRDYNPEAYISMDITDVSYIQQTASQLISKLYALADTSAIACLKPDEKGEQKIRLSFSFEMFLNKQTRGQRIINKLRKAKEQWTAKKAQ